MTISITDKITDKVYGDFRVDYLDENMNFLSTAVEEPNLVVNEGISVIIDNIFDSSHRLDKMKLGDDVGTGDQQNPEAPNVTYDSTTQSVLYESDTGVVGSVKSDAYTINYSWIVFGDIVLDKPEFENQNSVEFNSAGLYADDGRLFSYKRFSTISLSRVVNLSVSWVIYYNI